MVGVGTASWWLELNGGGGRGWRKKNLGERVKKENKNENTVGVFCFFLFCIFFFNKRS
jgi:hypothetical protein